MFTALPLLAIPVLLYNFIAIGSLAGAVASTDADATMRETWFSIPMASGGSWPVSVGDTLIFVGLIMLFFELLKSTSSRRVAIINHSLSLILFIACLVEFLLFRTFASSTFFLISTMVLLDVLAGFIVTIVAARKDVDYTGAH